MPWVTHHQVIGEALEPMKLFFFFNYMKCTDFSKVKNHLGINITLQKSKRNPHQRWTEEGQREGGGEGVILGGGRALLSSHLKETKYSRILVFL